MRRAPAISAETQSITLPIGDICSGTLSKLESSFSVTDRDSLHYRWHTYKKCIIDEKNKKKTQYALRDYLFKFWYEFVPKDTRVIEMGQGELYYQKAVKSVLHSFMGTVFEEMCRYYTLKQGIHVVFGSCITSVGTRWGAENVTDKTGSKRFHSADIDVVALSEIDNLYLKNTEDQCM